MFEQLGADRTDGEQAGRGAALGSGGELLGRLRRVRSGDTVPVDLGPPPRAVEEVGVVQVDADGGRQFGERVECMAAVGGRDGHGVERRCDGKYPSHRRRGGTAGHQVQETAVTAPVGWVT
ncbi:hypothetical protein EH183_42250 [Streptomyces sp. CB01881]|uniref:hypothetical protein n=1 Tax=Streptomyces sp. CB01881 TaxID=2078691 RepID=UPI0011DF47AD|nr:hypothetical protein [Streptomyces sp. CB01881]TYC66610.1 hypothetical protein EH183_42250 [Streptomyces sp. CB01881]